MCFLLEAFVCRYCPDRGEALSTVVSKPCFGVLGKKACPHRHPGLSSPQHSCSLFSDSNRKSIFKYPWFLPIATALIMLVSACHQILPVYSSSSVLRHVKQDPRAQGSCMDTTIERTKNSQARHCHSITPYLDIPCSCRVHLFVHLLKWEKNSCTDLKPIKILKN